jgi:hypothetical protein
MLTPHDCPFPIEQFDEWATKEQVLIEAGNYSV